MDPNENTSTKRKTDKVELSKRIRIVQDWILQDHVTPDIINQAKVLWNITDRQAYRYIWAARRFFEEKDTTSIKRKVSYYIARKKKLLRDMDPDEKKTAAGVAAINRVLDSMAKLEGVSIETVKLIGDENQPVHTVDHSANKIDLTKLSEKELETLIKLHGKAARD